MHTGSVWNLNAMLGKPWDVIINSFKYTLIVSLNHKDFFIELLLHLAFNFCFPKE